MNDQSSSSKFYYVLLLLLVPFAIAFSTPNSKTHTTTTSNTNNDVQQTLGTQIGIRPTLSEQSYAHQSAILNHPHPIQIKLSSPQMGLGAFATNFIPMGTMLGTYNGEILNKDQVQSRYWSTNTDADADAKSTTSDGEVVNQNDEEDAAWIQSRLDRGMGITGHYLFETPDGDYIDAEDADVSGWVRFMNHAVELTEECNVKGFWRGEKGGDQAEFPLMYATRDIHVVCTM